MTTLTERFSKFSFKLILAIISVVAFPSHAQDRLKFEIVDFDIDPFDLSAKNPQYEKFDGNGDRYAIIKVSTNNPDDDLDAYVFNFGNLKHIVENHDGILWIYVQRNAKLVTISRNGYVPINKYDLHTTIESGKNYIMSLTAEDKKVMTQMVRFNVAPKTANAVVMIKGFGEDSPEELFGHTDSEGSVAKNLEYGTYTYKVLADNYHMAEGRFTLNDKGVTHVEDVSLRPNFSDITFKVDADAEIYINGQKKGTRQWTGPLKAGNYQVECRQKNHTSTSQYVVVTDNDNRTISLQAPQPIIGTLAVTSDPLGAEILIDGKNYGETPRNIDILIGQHTLTLTKTNYQTEKKLVDVEEDKVTDVSIRLSRTTNVIIESNPVGCSLYIDGKYQGETPYNYEGEAGNHKVKLFRKGYLPIEKNVYLGDKDVVDFKLKKLLVKESGFYIGAGIGVGSAMNVSASVGAYIKNFNIEAYYNYYIGSPETIYWNYIGDSPWAETEECTYKPELILGGKLGYSFNLGDRFRVTPQLGYRHTDLKGQKVSGYCESISIGGSVYVAITSHFGISLTPEYLVGVSKSSSFSKLSQVSSKIKGFGEGFNANLSLTVSF